MSNRWLILILLILTLCLGGVIGYAIKLHQDVNALRQQRAESGSNRAPYRMHLPPGPTVSGAHPAGKSPIALNNIFDDQDDIDRQFERMSRMMDSFMSGAFSRAMTSGLSRLQSIDTGSAFEPQIDLQETKDSYLVLVDIPGVDKDKISVKLSGNRLTISGQREVVRENENSQSGVYHSERSFGSFLRTIELPADADAQAMNASTDKGVLTINIPKLKNSNAQVPIQ